MPLRLSGSRLWTMAGAITKAAFTPGMLRSSLSVSERGRAGGLGEERFGVGARELKLFLRRADPIVRVGVAESQKAVEIHTRASLDEGREAAGREARGAEPVEVEMGADRRIGLRRVERGREVARPLPVEDRAADRHRVAPVVARMVDGDHDIAHVAPKPFRTTP